MWRASLPRSRTDIFCAASGRPVELAKLDFCRPSSRALAFIFSAKARSLPARPSASVMQASLPDCTTAPWIRSSTRDLLWIGRNMLDVWDGAPPSPPRVLARHVFGIELDVALLELVEHDLRRHQLGHAGGRCRRVGVFLEQDGAGRGVEQDDVGRGGIEIAGLAADEADIGGCRDGGDRAGDEFHREEAATQRWSSASS